MNDLREAKVADFHKSIIANATPASAVHDEDVGGLKIAMQDILIVRRLHAGDYLAQQRCCSLCVECSFTTQEVIESLAFDVFHYQKENAVRTLAKVCDVYDVWMLYRSGGAGLAFKTRNGLAFLHVFVAEDVGSNGLDGDPAGNEVLIPSEINLAHCAPSNSLLEQIATG
jgi:hypothetical protein